MPLYGGWKHSRFQELYIHGKGGKNQFALRQIEALEHASRTPEPLAEEPALKRQRHGQGS